jgi:tetratricopeptide (TPR) repeat protein
MPDHAGAFNNRGNARRDKGDLDGALQDLTEAIRLKPGCADAFHNRGNARIAKGDLDGALPDFTKAIRLKPD